MTPEEQIAEMERITGYTFENRQLSVECLYHGGLPIFLDGVFQEPARNGRLAVLGDSLLDTVLISEWYRTRDAEGNKLCICLHKLLMQCRSSACQGTLERHHSR